MRADVGRRPRPEPLAFSVGHASDHGLDPGRALVLLPHRLPAVDAPSALPLYAQHGVEQSLMLPARADATERRLEAPHVKEHLVELLPCLEACEDRLHSGHAVLELLLVLHGPVLAVPLLEDVAIGAILALQLPDVPHPLGRLNLSNGDGLFLDPPPDHRASHILLQQVQGLLLMGLRKNVRRVVGDDVVGEVVVVALRSGAEARRLQALQEPMLLRRLLQRRLEGVRMEEQPRVALAGAVFVGLAFSRKETPAIREADVQQRQVVPQTGGL
mmetsp:Transcript_24929/g.71533  ORF Transcript_24929/g.71533 Transcript_24929/m.71533 type:complete len:272 (+) Transcript_24929:2643-3458(+)